jgi:hypothetical protein
MVDPLNPNEIPFELEKTIVWRLLEVVPAETFTGEGAAVMLTLPVMYPADTPKLMLLALEKHCEISVPERLKLIACAVFQCDGRIS